MSELELAATVVLLRDSTAGPRVLMLQRPRHTGSFAGAWVFPGGKVDPGDFADVGPADEQAGARCAGARETLEETGLTVGADSLVPISRWMPPEDTPRRFRTWFYLAAAPDGPIRLNAGEHIDYEWMTPREGLDRHAAGAIGLVPPTWITLNGLLGAANTADAVEHAHNSQPRLYASRPRITAEGRRVITWSGDDAYEAGADDVGPGGDARHRLDITDLPWTFIRH